MAPYMVKFKKTRKIIIFLAYEHRMPVVMLAIERSERVSITTGKAVQKNVAEGDPLTVMGIGVASGDDMGGLQHRGCLPLHSLRSFH